ncbi:MAG: nucleoside-diphosphate kinase [Pyrodictiaceae archaeon]
MAREITFVMVKPDGVKRGLVGEIISRFERKGLRLKALKMKWLTREEAEKLYEEHRGKHFFNDLIDFVTSGPVVAMLLEGDNAVSVVRIMIGPTDGREAPPGTIRGDYSLSKQENVIHASDSPEKVWKEASVFFSKDEIIDRDY